jgi:hypothetical protein
MVPYKRPAADKSGIPVYQPSATNYQQLMHMQQPFVPVSCESFAKSINERNFNEFLIILSVLSISTTDIYKLQDFQLQGK